MAIQPKDPAGDDSEPKRPMIQRSEPVPIDVDEDEAIALADDAAGDSSGGPSKIQTFGTAAGRVEAKTDFKRPLNLTGAGATRCRMFHSKVTLTALDHMISTVNEWLDSEEIELKYISQVIGTMEGKKPEPNVIITVWY